MQLHETNRPEILAPAGDLSMLSAAVFSGADAVYLGLEGFNARRSAGNFTTETLRDAVAFCHARGVRVHVALNTLVFAQELDALAQNIRAAAECGADALIVDDLATAVLAKQIAPALALHGSTQMSIHTPAGAQMLAKLGFSRVILARELSLPEIRAITESCPIETEIFVHGALCMSMSGQCMMSAFLGGRSGNRGACAGPCRLPFDAAPLRPGVPARNFHLSLRDLDLVPHLGEIAAAGVASVKIEGRLRTPEYAAAAVAACRAELAGEPYDKTLLQNIFSRSGFTDAWYAGHTGREMFGVRTALDSAVTKAVEPKARELYRREFSRIPVDFSLHLAQGGAKLTVTDPDGNRAEADAAGPFDAARADPAPALTRNLEKTGGTPFRAGVCRVETEGGPWFVPGGTVNSLRRDCLAELLHTRSVPKPLPVFPAPALEFPARSGFSPVLAARFETVSQLPGHAVESLAALIFPIAEAEKVPAALRSKTVLELPRAMFGGLEADTAQRIARWQQAGFAGFAANNLAHFALAAGLPLFGGLGLNLTNPLAAEQYRALGLSGMLIHPETAVTAMRTIQPGVPTAALAYGHLPLMLTRACPLQNVHDCTQCARRGTLRDRKGRDFAVRCSLGMRTIYNPVPLYMGDRRCEMPVDAAVAYFTLESAEECSHILGLLEAGLPFDGEFTRGLYYKSV
jgi:putative protease